MALNTVDASRLLVRTTRSISPTAESSMLRSASLYNNAIIIVIMIMAVLACFEQSSFSTKSADTVAMPSSFQESH